jgi:hypothetical protein
MPTADRLPHLSSERYGHILCLCRSFRETSAGSILTFMMLNKRERNTIFQEIVRSKLDPAKFDLEDTDDKVVITHESGSTFEFSRQEEPDLDFAILEEISVPVSELPTIVRYRYTANVMEGINETSTTSRLNFVIGNNIPLWLREIKATVGVPDYWGEMKRSRESIAVIQRGDFENSLFGQAEQGQIAAQVQQVKKQVEELFALSSEQKTQVNEKLDEVVEAASRLGRKDWVVLFTGTILTLAITDAVTWATAHHIWAMVLHGLLHLFTGGNEPPQILF